jgi:2-keto-4-pentenoate hydratase/2-oxohepta-3-ene-1,7-dioic acid hydratase in catechol pathway
VELVVVMGRKCRRVTKEDAKDFIFGYTIAQDITAREWQKRNGGQWLLGKHIYTNLVHLNDVEK